MVTSRYRWYRRGTGFRVAALQPAQNLAEDCKFHHFTILIKNIMNFLLFTIAMSLAALLFAYAEFLYLTAGGNESKVKQAHEIFKYVLIGFV